jgi:hypothetical protein
MPPVLMTWPGKSCDWFFKSSNAQTRLETPGVESRPSVAECHTRCGPEASSHRFGALVSGTGFHQVIIYLHVRTSVSAGVRCARGRYRREAIARGPAPRCAQKSAEPVAACGSLVDGPLYGSRYLSRRLP